MPDVLPTKEKGQRSQYPDMWLYRILPQWTTPEWVQGERWRMIVQNQPVAMNCRETLIDNALSLDWKIESVESNQRDELKSEIQYYTDFLNYNGEIDFSTHLEWIGQDLLDLPFGAASEVGRENDEPEGRVLWIELLDGATLFPTLNKNSPVGQRIEGLPLNPVIFPAHAINRVYMSPRTTMKRWGWGMAPPEKIYLAMQMLSRGDVYYANLLLDTPEAGILDLMDMEKEAAEQWVESFRSLMNGVDPFKIPVLYEHTSEAKYIPFGKPPTDLMFDKISMKQAAIVAAGYGLTLSDIGLSGATNGGDTLAGAIRSERRAKKIGYAKFNRKLREYFQRYLPKTLKFSWIDYDDELSVALGRARLANATAWGLLVDKRIFTPQEARLQSISDGLVTISVPEEVEEEGFDILPVAAPSPNNPGMLGKPVSPSQGGYGEKRSRAKDSLKFRFFQALSKVNNDASDERLGKLIKAVAPVVYNKMVNPGVELSEAEDSALVERAFEDAVAEDNWWDIDIDDEELAVILSLAFIGAVERSAKEIIADLYAGGYLPSPHLDPNLVFRLTNEFVLDSLRTRSASIIANVNQGTKYYLRRILSKAVKDGLIDLNVTKDIDIQEILSDNGFVQRLSQNVKRELTNLVEFRAGVIASYEQEVVEGAGRIAQWRRLGLSRKVWEHFGSDEPCEYCQDNIKAGVVPLDYMYRGAFGDVDADPAHPGEHCRTKYVKGDLFSLATRGQIYIWTGD